MIYTDRGRVTVDLILFRGTQSCELSCLLCAYSMPGPGLSSLLALTPFNAATVPVGKWEYFFFPYMDHFKVSIELVTILLLFYVFGVVFFDHDRCGILAS